jgi:predicted extracellular nuclease
LSRLDDVVAQAQMAQADGDLVLAGDFNSMGCEKCTPKLNGAAEVSELDGILRGARPAFRRVPARPSCTHYFRGEGSLLDHFVVTASTRELAQAASARVGGYCSELSCSPFEESHQLAAYRELSDHCPVILDFTDRDLD